MSQITSGFKKILSHPYVYNALQMILGSKNASQQYVTHYIRPKQQDTILDIGCGTANILNFLPSQIEYYGFDLNKEYIEHARRVFGKRGQFICANVNNIDTNSFPKFNIILATAIMHHLDDNEVMILLNKAKSLLKENGRLITLDCCYINNQSKIARYMINQDRGQNVRAAEGYQTLALKIFKEVQVHIRHDFLRIPYTLAIMECNA
jgi:SAM-dependent methyltransferase